MKLSEQIAATYQFSIKDEDLMAWEAYAKQLEAELEAARGLVSCLIEGDESRKQTDIELEAIDALERWRKEGWEI